MQASFAFSRSVPIGVPAGRRTLSVPRAAEGDGRVDDLSADQRERAIKRQLQQSQLRQEGSEGFSAVNTNDAARWRANIGDNKGGQLVSPMPEAAAASESVLAGVKERTGLLAAEQEARGLERLLGEANQHASSAFAAEGGPAQAEEGAEANGTAKSEFDPTEMLRDGSMLFRF